MTHKVEETRDSSIEAAMRIIKSYDGMEEKFRQRIYNSFNKVMDPGGLARDFHSKVREKQLTGASAAKYFFRCWMNEVNQ